MDRIRNKTIRTKLGMKKNILQEIEEQQLRWYGHVMRMDDCRTARQVADWNPQGKRRRGRPVNTWKDGIRDSMQRRKLKDKECFDREIGERKLCLQVEENCVFTEKFLNNKKLVLVITNLENSLV
jgi:hypothetical protein